MRHRRVVPLLGEVVALHAEGLELAARGVVLRAFAGRNRPMVERPSVDLDGHLLDRLVDGDLNGGLCGRRNAKCAGGERERKTVTRHGSIFPNASEAQANDALWRDLFQTGMGGRAATLMTRT